MLTYKITISYFTAIKPSIYHSCNCIDIFIYKNYIIPLLCMLMYLSVCLPTYLCACVDGIYFLMPNLNLAMYIYPGEWHNFLLIMSPSPGIYFVFFNRNITCTAFCSEKKASNSFTVVHTCFIFQRILWKVLK